MKIYLMRHAPQMAKHQDPEEGLSPAGEEVAKNSAAALKAMGLCFDIIIASPKKRAQQTALAVAQATGFDPERIATNELLRPMTPARETVNLLPQYEDLENVLLVGHLPNLALVASGLLSGSTEVKLVFKPGCVCRLDQEKPGIGGALLHWLLPSEQLALMAPVGL